MCIFHAETLVRCCCMLVVGGCIWKMVRSVSRPLAAAPSIQQRRDGEVSSRSTAGQGSVNGTGQLRRCRSAGSAERTSMQRDAAAIARTMQSLGVTSCMRRSCPQCCRMRMHCGAECLSPTVALPLFFSLFLFLCVRQLRCRLRGAQSSRREELRVKGDRSHQAR